MIVECLKMGMNKSTVDLVTKLHNIKQEGYTQDCVVEVQDIRLMDGRQPAWWLIAAHWIIFDSLYFC